MLFRWVVLAQTHSESTSQHPPRHTVTRKRWSTRRLAVFLSISLTVFALLLYTWVSSAPALFAPLLHSFMREFMRESLIRMHQDLGLQGTDVTFWNFATQMIMTSHQAILYGTSMELKAASQPACSSSSWRSESTTNYSTWILTQAAPWFGSIAAWNLISQALNM